MSPYMLPERNETMAEYPDLTPDVDLRFGDCLAVLRQLPDESVHAIITDPPYGLAEHKPEHIAYALIEWTWGNNREWVPDGRGFMGRAWDAFVPPPAVWDECLRVLKPGGHLAAFAGSRTYDLMGMSIRLAGFEIRDGLQWLYGSGMPKGQNVGKAIDKAADAVREVVGTKMGLPGYTLSGGTEGGGVLGDGITSKTQAQRLAETAITAPATPEAARWEGWNTSLKPSQEPIVLARKPIRGTVAANVLATGCGAMNVDACRVNPGTPVGGGGNGAGNVGGIMGPKTGMRPRVEPHTAGRWPANVLLSHAPECHEPGECAPGCPVAELDAQSGPSKSPSGPVSGPRTHGGVMGRRIEGELRQSNSGHGDEGGASRFFPSFRYQAKAPASERPKIDGKGWPTVKPQGLMRWLVRLLAPPGGVVLDPFAGTSATLQAARDEGFASIGIERDEFAYLLSCRRLGLPELVPATVTDAETGEPVALAESAVEPEPVVEPPAPVDPVLVAIAEATSREALVALWREHRTTWTDEYTAAAEARQVELAEGAAA